MVGTIRKQKAPLHGRGIRSCAITAQAAASNERLTIGVRGGHHCLDERPEIADERRANGRESARKSPRPDEFDLGARSQQIFVHDRIWGRPLP
jgi:hypothetical protein